MSHPQRNKPVETTEMNQMRKLWTVIRATTFPGCKESHFTACHSGKLKLTFTTTNIISTNPQNFLMSRIDFTVLQWKLNSSKYFTCPVGQVKNRIHQPDSKIHQSRGIGHYFLCMLLPPIYGTIIFQPHYFLCNVTQLQNLDSVKQRQSYVFNVKWKLTLFLVLSLTYKGRQAEILATLRVLWQISTLNTPLS